MYILHEDAQDAWLQVPVDAVVELRVVNMVTGQSYRSGDTAYLQAVIDADSFIRAWLRHYGRSEKDDSFFRQHVKEKWDGHFSFIRTLPPFYVEPPGSV
jgi:hypothetical protein